ncbi:MAG: RcpC/CpaB family pilus assembly protein [Hyphomonas sp.]|uniref:Flp pilus assembly protein CpaB n=1 Tax=Hyphomonas sp. TaxID=87 RepID=UPI00329999E9
MNTTFDTTVMRVLGALIAFFVGYLYWNNVTSQDTELMKKLQISSGLEAPLPRGTILRESNLQSFQVDANEGVRDAFEYALDDTPDMRSALVGQRLSQSISPGALLERRFFTDDTTQEFAARLGADMRAFSLDIGGSQSLLNFVGPGSRVDVVGAVEGANDVLVPTTLLENVEVLAVGPIDDISELDAEEAGQYRSVTFGATPEQISAYLGQATLVRGEMLLALRSGQAGGSAP